MLCSGWLRLPAAGSVGRPSMFKGAVTSSGFSAIEGFHEAGNRPFFRKTLPKLRRNPASALTPRRNADSTGAQVIA